MKAGPARAVASRLAAERRNRRGRRYSLVTVPSVMESGSGRSR
jgi:hypothetical protein